MKTRREKNRSSGCCVVSCCANLKVSSSQVQVAWPGRARSAFTAPQRAVQLSGGPARPTNPSATQRDAFWNGLGYAVRRHQQIPECSRTPSNWKNGVYQCNGAKLWSIMDINIEHEHACVTIWAIWVQLLVEPGENQSSYSLSLENSLAGENQSSYFSQKKTSFS